MYSILIKRNLDLLSSILLLFLLFIPGVVIAILIKVDSSGSVFYRQQRIGRNGRLFSIYKFRTMVANAEKIGSFSTAVNDSRITKVGAFLRKTSLDELPQIINIIFGEMSFIGPRPDVPQQRDLYSKFEFAQRHQVLPGITGLAQCLNRHNATLQERKQSDIFYANNVSFALDVKILVLTIKTVLKGSY